MALRWNLYELRSSPTRPSPGTARSAQNLLAALERGLG
jgi:hypothetical protein